MDFKQNFLKCKKKKIDPPPTVNKFYTFFLKATLCHIFKNFLIKTSNLLTDGQCM